jgi:hypothetical protein
MSRIGKVTEAKPNQQSMGASGGGELYDADISYLPRRGNGRAGDSKPTPQAAIMKRGKGKLYGSYPTNPQKMRGR